MLDETDGVIRITHPTETRGIAARMRRSNAIMKPWLGNPYAWRERRRTTGGKALPRPTTRRPSKRGCLVLVILLSEAISTVPALQLVQRHDCLLHEKRQASCVVLRQARHRLAEVPDDLPREWYHLQRLGDRFAELAPQRSAAVAGGGAGGDALAWQVLWERLARRPPALKWRDARRLGGGALGGDFVLGGGGLGLNQLQPNLLD